MTVKYTPEQGVPHSHPQRCSGGNHLCAHRHILYFAKRHQNHFTAVKANDLGFQFFGASRRTDQTQFTDVGLWDCRPDQ